MRDTLLQYTQSECLKSVPQHVWAYEIFLHIVETILLSDSEFSPYRRGIPVKYSVTDRYH